MRKTVEQYCRALERGDFSSASAFLDPDDVLLFWESMCRVEEALVRVGEKSTTFGILGDPDASSSFKAFQPQELMAAFLRASVGDTAGLSCEVLTVDEVGPGRGLAVYNVGGFANTMDLALRHGKWFVKLRVGLEQMAGGFLSRASDFEARSLRDKAHEQAGELTKFNLIGYADGQGQTVIEPRFTEGEEFSEGLAAVKVISQWGYIDASAKLVIPAQFRCAQPFSEGVAWVAPYNQEERKLALIDQQGRLLIPPRFDLAEDFSEGLAAVKESELWGFVNKKGDWIIQPRFTFADSFSEGLAEVGDEEGNYLYIDTNGQSLGD